MADGEQTPPSAGGWPPPHPSPPLPPPREYGAPGSTPNRVPWLIGAAAVVLVVVVIGVLVAVLGGGDDEPESRATDTPSATETAEPSETAAAAPSYTCWDGAAAATLEECSAPTGKAGLAWVFPAIADARCGEAQAAGGPGVVTRVLCISRLADGAKLQIGYYEWAGVDQAASFYDGRGLTRADGTDLITWTGEDGDRATAASLYLADPYSVTLTYPAAATLSPEDQATLAPRPAAEVRGVPAQ